MSKVDEEFQRIREHIRRAVVVTEQFHDKEVKTTGILNEFRPYSAVELLLQQGAVAAGQEASLSQVCSFIGVFAGIKEIANEHGDILYHNDSLSYQKGFYDCWHDGEDNKHINSMRKAKFGQGHEYALFEPLQS